MNQPALQTLPDQVRYDLGCGLNPREGFTGVDLHAPGAVRLDVREPWPWADASVDELHCSHLIEHLTGAEQIHLMNEACRVLKVGCQLTVITPWWNSVRFHQDPTHVKAFPDNAAFYYNKAWRDANKLDHYPITADFDFTVSYSFSDPRWLSANEQARQFAIRYYTNVVDDVIIVFKKR